MQDNKLDVVCESLTAAYENEYESCKYLDSFV